MLELCFGGAKMYAVALHREGFHRRCNMQLFAYAMSKPLGCAFLSQSTCHTSREMASVRTLSDVL